MAWHRLSKQLAHWGADLISATPQAGRLLTIYQARVSPHTGEAVTDFSLLYGICIAMCRTIVNLYFMDSVSINIKWLFMIHGGCGTSYLKKNVYSCLRSTSSWIYNNQSNSDVTFYLLYEMLLHNLIAGDRQAILRWYTLPVQSRYRYNLGPFIFWKNTIHQINFVCLQLWCLFSNIYFLFILRWLIQYQRKRKGLSTSKQNIYWLCIYLSDEAFMSFPFYPPSCAEVEYYRAHQYE